MWIHFFPVCYRWIPSFLWILFCLLVFSQLSCTVCMFLEWDNGPCWGGVPQYGGSLEWNSEIVISELSIISVSVTPLYVTVLMDLLFCFWFHSRSLQTERPPVESAPVFSALADEGTLEEKPTTEHQTSSGDRFDPEDFNCVVNLIQTGLY